MKTMKYFKLYFAFIAITALTAVFNACSKDSDDLTDRNYNNNEEHVPQTVATLEQLKGTWMCYNDSLSHAVIIVFEDEGLGGRQHYIYNSTENTYKPVSQITYFNYTYDEHTGMISMTGTDSYNGSTFNEQWQVKSLQGDNAVFIDLHASYTYRAIRYQDEESTTEDSSNGWAPGNVSGMHLTLSNYSSGSNNEYHIYFTSNSTIDAESNAGAYILSGATYEKTGDNTATVGCTTSYTHYAYLTFTSATGGTFKWSSGATGTFTLKNESASSNFQAPSSIAYMTFTDGPGGVVEKYMTFGSQTGNSVRVVSTNWNTSTNIYNYTYNVTYTRQTSTLAYLDIIVTATSKSSMTSTTFTDNWKYALTFTSSSSGNYSRYYTTTNRFGSSDTSTGRFSLK